MCRLFATNSKKKWQKSEPFYLDLFLLLWQLILFNVADAYRMQQFYWARKKNRTQVLKLILGSKYTTVLRQQQKQQQQQPHHRHTRIFKWIETHYTLLIAQDKWCRSFPYIWAHFNLCGIHVGLCSFPRFSMGTFFNFFPPHQIQRTLYNHWFELRANKVELYENLSIDFIEIGFPI